MNLNKALIVGRLTGDPELRATPSGAQVTNFSMATNRVWYVDEVKKEAVEFHNIVVWGKQAEVAKNYLVKGGLVLIEGRLQTRQWEAKDGAKRQTTEIVCEKLQLGSKAETKKVELAKKQEPVTGEVASEEIKTEDLPF